MYQYALQVAAENDRSSRALAYRIRLIQDEVIVDAKRDSTSPQQSQQQSQQQQGNHQTQPGSGKGSKGGSKKEKTAAAIDESLGDYPRAAESFTE